MSTVPQIFNFNNTQLRIIIQSNGEPLFCASDVTNALGYSNGRAAVASHCRSKGVVKCDTLTSGGTQELTFLSEPNLYRLTLRSQAPHAEVFQDWVTEDVLPTVRKTGNYSVQPSIPAIPLPALDDTIGWIEYALKEAKDNKQKSLLLKQSQEETQTLKAQVEVTQPKVEFAELVMSAEGNYSISTAAKILGQPHPRKFFEFLREVGELLSSKREWNMPRAQLMQAGYYKVVTKPHTPSTGPQAGRTFTNNVTEVTPRGLFHIHRLLVKHCKNVTDMETLKAQFPGVR